MPKEINSDSAREMGIMTNHELMDNGERRFRLQAADGSAYIRTQASASGAWQNSHYHSSMREMCIVQEGWAILAEELEGGICFQKFTKNEYFITQPNIPHNLFMSRGSVLHTVKYGDITQSDWISRPQLDEITKALSEKEVLEMVVRITKRRG